MAIIGFESWIDGGIERVKDFAPEVMEFEMQGDNFASIVVGSFGNYNIAKNNTTRLMQVSVILLADTDYDKYLQNIVNSNYAAYTDPAARRVSVVASTRSVSFDVVNIAPPSFSFAHNGVANTGGGTKSYLIQCVPITGFDVI